MLRIPTLFALIAIVFLIAEGCGTRSPACKQITLQLRNAATDEPVANTTVTIADFSGSTPETAVESRFYTEETDGNGGLPIRVCGESYILDFVNVPFETDVQRTELLVPRQGSSDFDKITLKYTTTYLMGPSGTSIPNGFDAKVIAPDSIVVTFLPYYPYP